MAHSGPPRSDDPQIWTPGDEHPQDEGVAQLMGWDGMGIHHSCRHGDSMLTTITTPPPLHSTMGCGGVVVVWPWP